ncbi:MAG: saccharopine dehydrogenase C-terminal domain-containing protein [Desulfobacteraceae bacterium]|jgi:saccharopine dehydrogenase-like NADP-dependent oxidoreductase|nr:saccharopine dehydrogenase C-terminal domain-containing protein [Desulfobacteraceae bacterium]
MKIVVLGGLGLQGRAAVIDLMRSSQVTEVVCVDAHTQGLETFSALEGFAKLKAKTLDAGSREALAELLAQGADAAIDLLPLRFMRGAFEAAVHTGVPLVSTNYAHPLADLDEAARRRPVVLMPECGLDPGIDLVIMGEAVRRFETLTRLDSYCGGIPEPSACDNPLGYKISWNFEMVLTSQMRPSRFVRDGRLLEVPAEAQHESEMNHEIDFPGLGRLEAIPNGDAVAYVERLGLSGTISESGRYSLRWPGWRDFWRVAKRLGLLEETPVPGLAGAISPRQFMVRHLEPRLQYGPDERDLTPMVNVFEGQCQGRPLRLTTRLLIARDLDSGLLAMNMGVGYTASVVAQMIAGGEIADPGLRSPVRDIPYGRFMDEMRHRGVRIEEELIWLD